MKYKTGIILMFGIPYLMLMISCEHNYSNLDKLDIQGHRGFRGSFPENTILGMIEALKTGVKTLEFDVVISSDNKVLLSHEPFMNEDICLDSTGKKIVNGKEFNIYKMSYDEIKNFDCGILGNLQFPEQKKISSQKPLLSDLIDSLEAFRILKNIPFPTLNIEIKSRIEWENEFHPYYKDYLDLVIRLIDSKQRRQNIIIQSFDSRVIHYANSEYPDLKLAYLSENPLSWESDLEMLGFQPYIYSPNYQLLTQSIVSQIQSRNILLIPWTVNEENDIKSLLKMGVDGIITDYPNRTISIKKDLINQE